MDTDESAPDVLLYPFERHQLGAAWFFGDVSADDLRRWVAECFPGRLAGLQHRRPDDANFTNSEVVFSLIRHRAGIGLSTGANDGGFLHEVAQRALAEGRPSLLLDLHEFYTTAPFACLTRYAPGAPMEQEWLDPQRGLAAGARADAWISEVTTHSSLEDFILQESPSPGEPFGGVRARHRGTLESTLKAWMAEGIAVEPRPDLVDLESERELHSHLFPSPSAPRWWQGLAGFVGLAVVLLAASGLLSLALSPRQLPFAVLQGILTTAVTGWCAFLDFRRGDGPLVPAAIGFLVLGVLPGAVPLLLLATGVIP
ncbi:MAG: hypothetical protein SFW67_33605 [Myxococcaceae bacterium]|nr:hypothetical protein [Myxococcaceae bacterium]